MLSHLADEASVGHDLVFQIQMRDVADALKRGGNFAPRRQQLPQHRIGGEVAVVKLIVKGRQRERVVGYQLLKVLRQACIVTFARAAAKMSSCECTRAATQRLRLPLGNAL